MSSHIWHNLWFETYSGLAILCCFTINPFPIPCIAPQSWWLVYPCYVQLQTENQEPLHGLHFLIVWFILWEVYSNYLLLNHVTMRKKKKHCSLISSVQHLKTIKIKRIIFLYLMEMLKRGNRLCIKITESSNPKIIYCQLFR